MRIILLLLLLPVFLQSDAAEEGVPSSLASAAMSKVGEAASELVALTRREVERGSREAVARHDEALTSLDSYPDHCRKLSQGSVQALRSSSFVDFITCPRLGDALSDLGNMLTATLLVTSNFTGSLQVMIESFNCTDKGVWGNFVCVMDALNNLRGVLTGQFVAIEGYVENLVSLGKNISTSVQLCLNKDTTDTKLFLAMEPAKKCYDNFKSEQTIIR